MKAYISVVVLLYSLGRLDESKQSFQKTLLNWEQCLETDPSSKHLRDTLVFRLSSAVKTHAPRHFVDGFKWVLNKLWDHRMIVIHQSTQAYFSIQMLASGSGQSFLRSLFLLPPLFYFLKFLWFELVFQIAIISISMYEWNGLLWIVRFMSTDPWWIDVRSRISWLRQNDIFCDDSYVQSLFAAYLLVCVIHQFVVIFI